MDILYNKNEIILINQKHFIPKDVFECGQCFRWILEEDNSYTIIAHNRILNISSDENNNIIFRNTCKKDFEEIWINYFDLETDYSAIIEKIKVDQVMKKATNYGKGIRILNQDKFEMMISFMISANNRIPMIKKVIENLSNKFGDFIGTYKGQDYYSFPSIKSLAEADLEDIQACKAGFRSERIKEACQRLMKNKEDLSSLYNIDSCNYDSALEYLKTYKGIGNKVANCILLFAGKQTNAFPIDVWVRRIMQYLYNLEDKNDKDIEKFALDKYGDLSGYAQQYLFYYAREENIQKK